MGGWEKSLLRPMLHGGILQPLTQTNSRSSCSVEETILHWKPFSPSVASARTSSQRWRPDSEDRAKTRSICNGLHRILSAPRAHSTWSLRTGLLGLSGKARTARSEPAQSYARSSADREFILTRPKAQPSSARLQRQQAGWGRLKPGARRTVQAQLWRP